MSETDVIIIIQPESEFIIYFCCILLLCFSSIRFTGMGQFFPDYLVPRSTTAVRELFNLLGFLSLFSQYVNMKKVFDAPCMVFVSYMGQAIIA